MLRLPRFMSFTAPFAALVALALIALPNSAEARAGKTFKSIDVPHAEAAEEESGALEDEMDDENGKDVEAEFNCEEADFGEPRQRCLRIRRLRNFRVIDDRHALFYESPRRVFLVTFAVPCRELRWSFGLRVSSRSGDLCGFAGERIFVGTGAFREQCHVRSVELVESEEHGQCLVAARMRDRARNGEDENDDLDEDGEDPEDEVEDEEDPEGR